MDAEAVIDALGMQPHPEGGWFVETFRDAAGGPRGHSTAIYYLLKAGERSHWHRVRDAVEVWHYHAGAPLALYSAPEGTAVETIVLGADLLRGERPQAIIPAMAGRRRKASATTRWSAARLRPASTMRASKWRRPAGRPRRAGRRTPRRR